MGTFGEVAQKGGSGSNSTKGFPALQGPQGGDPPEVARLGGEKDLSRGPEAHALSLWLLKGSQGDPAPINGEETPFFDPVEEEGFVGTNCDETTVLGSVCSGHLGRNGHGPLGKSLHFLQHHRFTSPQGRWVSVDRKGVLSALGDQIHLTSRKHKDRLYVSRPVREGHGEALAPKGPIIQECRLWDSQDLDLWPDLLVVPGVGEIEASPGGAIPNRKILPIPHADTPDGDLGFRAPFGIEGVEKGFAPIIVTPENSGLGTTPGDA